MDICMCFYSREEWVYRKQRNKEQISIAILPSETYLCLGPVIRSPGNIYVRVCVCLCVQVSKQISLLSNWISSPNSWMKNIKNNICKCSMNLRSQTESFLIIKKWWMTRFLSWKQIMQSISFSVSRSSTSLELNTSLNVQGRGVILSLLVPIQLPTG